MAAQTSPHSALLLCTFYLAQAARRPPLAPSAGRYGVWEEHISTTLFSAYSAFIMLSFWIISSDGLAMVADTFLRVECNCSLALQHVLASPGLSSARRERAGQVSGQGAALIPHKWGGIPGPHAGWAQYVQTQGDIPGKTCSSNDCM